MSNLREQRAYPPPAELTWTPCPACESDAFVPYGEENGFKIARCTRCNLVMVNPLPSAKYLGEFYAQYHQTDSAGVWGECMSTVFARAADDVAAEFPGGRVLDVGCGFGAFVGQCSRRGLQATGVEPAELPSQHATRTSGGEILHGMLEDVELPAESFDAVTLWFVLEHVLDPWATLRRCRELLKPGGRILIAVPNMEFRRHLTSLGRLPLLDGLLMRSPIKVGTLRFFHALDPPGHLFGFDRQSLRQTLERAGFVDNAFEIPADLRHTNRTSRLVERGLNFGASVAQSLSRGRLMPSNSMLARARRGP